MISEKNLTKNNKLRKEFFMSHRSQSGSSIVITIVMLLIITVISGVTYVRINNAEKSVETTGSTSQSQKLDSKPEIKTETDSDSEANSTSSTSGSDSNQLSDTRATTEMNELYANLEYYYNEYGYYPETLDLTELTKLTQTDITDESGSPYEYTSSVCDTGACEKYVLKYMFKLSNVAADTDGDGMIIKYSLN